MIYDGARDESPLGLRVLVGLGARAGGDGDGSSSVKSITLPSEEAYEAVEMPEDVREEGGGWPDSGIGGRSGDKGLSLGGGEVKEEVMESLRECG